VNYRQGQKKKVFAALSGGVDSSVAAALLKKQNFNVIGCHIKCYNVDGCAEGDAEDARRVAEQLDIPFYIFDFEQAYKERVMQYMVDGYRAGLTPNPDVMCNKEVKFGLFLQRALALGADWVATGHYIRLIKAGRGVERRRVLKIARDKNKDQSYFLWTLTPDQLQHCLFPLGGYTKQQVRLLARKFCLLTADKKDSQGICFLGKVMLADFLKQYIPEKQGAVLNAAGQLLGEHRGAQFYTIGQRHGFSHSNILKNIGMKPHYVAEKNVETNTLVVAEGDTNPSLYRKEVVLQEINFLNPNLITSGAFRLKGVPVLTRVRYRQLLAPAVLCQLAGGRYKLIFSRPQRFVAPGQSAVFYSKDGELLGGGVISSAS